MQFRWHGTIDGDLNKTGNWQMNTGSWVAANRLPTAGDTCIINSGAPEMESGTLTCDSLTGNCYFYGGTYNCTMNIGVTIDEPSIICNGTVNASDDTISISAGTYNGTVVAAGGISGGTFNGTTTVTKPAPYVGNKLGIQGIFNGRLILLCSTSGLTIAGEVVFKQANNSLTAVAYAAGGSSVAAAANVRAGVTNCGGTGTMTLPAAADVRSASQYGSGGTERTGTLVLPDATDVLKDVQYGSGGTEMTGTLVQESGVQLESTSHRYLPFGWRRVPGASSYRVYCNDVLQKTVSDVYTKVVLPRYPNTVRVDALDAGDNVLATGECKVGETSSGRRRISLV